MNNWVPIERLRIPCPICGHKDACAVKRDGLAVACLRVEKGCKRRRNGAPVMFREGMGYVHELGESREPVEIVRTVPPPKPVRINCPRLQQEFTHAIREEDVVALAKSLSVSAESLSRLGIGWSDVHDAHTFPMYGSARQIIGFRTRKADGRKRAIAGSRNGVFLAEPYAGSGAVLIAEGPTDTAALLTMGFDAIGRSHNTGNVEILRALLRREERPVWILADNDEPGIAGAKGLAAQLDQMVKVITPVKCKDVREWLAKGCTRALLESVAKMRSYFHKQGAAA